MKVFISHSWKDKTTADMLAKDLSSMADVWQDIQQIKPGERIQAIIDEALKDMDIVLVLWSRNGASSGGMAKEIETCLRLGKTMIPCLLDDTSLESKPEIETILGIDFSDYGLGYGRLCIVLTRFQAADLGIDMAEELEAVKDIEGVLDYMNQYCIKKGIKPTDKSHWISRSIESLNRMEERLAKLQGRVRNSIDFIQDIFERWQQIGEDRTKLQALLQEVIRKEHIDPEVIGQVRALIERAIGKLPPEEKISPPAITKCIRQAEGFSHGLRNTAEQGLRQIQDRLRPHMAQPQLEQAADLLLYYIMAARQSLEVLSRFCAQAGSQAGAQVVEHLFEYLEDPYDLLPEAEYGIWGYLDDAWLIHNTAYRLAESNLIPATIFPVDWDRIVAADRIARGCLPGPILQQLEDYLMQFLNLMASEAIAYNPAFMAMRNGYHPYIEAGYGGGWNDGDDLIHDMVDYKVFY
jgi:hypothetical protein